MHIELYKILMLFRKKFQSKCDHEIHLINWASSNGHIDILNLWKDSRTDLKYSYDAIDGASYNGGHINTLDWWKNSNLELKYSDDTMDWASKSGNVNILTL